MKICDQKRSCIFQEFLKFFRLFLKQFELENSKISRYTYKIQGLIRRKEYPLILGTRTLVFGMYFFNLSLLID